MVLGIVTNGLAHLRDSVLQRLGDGPHLFAVLLLQPLGLGIHQLLSHYMQLFLGCFQLFIKLLTLSPQLVGRLFTLSPQLVGRLFALQAQLLGKAFLCLLLFYLTLLAQEVHLGFLTRQLYGHPSHLGTHHEIERQGSYRYTY